MIIKKTRDGKWFIDCRSMKNGKSSGSRRYFDTAEEFTDFIVDYLSEKTKTNLKELDSVAIFDNHGDLFYLKNKEN